jgi:hypothetical protein
MKKSNDRKNGIKVPPWAILAILFLITIVVSVVLVWCTGVDPNMAFPLMLVFGVMALISVLALASALLDNLGLSSKSEALGLPKGSVRALIALSLIIIFAIMLVYMQMQLSASPVKDANGTILQDVNGTVQFYEPSQEKKDFALQTLTTISTLVVAVAGFYFGTRSVEVARGEPARTLTLSSPSNPHDMSAADKELLIILKPTPEDESVTWETSPDGDNKGTLVQIEPNRFKYTPSQDFKGTVTMRFKLSRYPDVKVELKVERKPPANASSGSSGNTGSTGGTGGGASSSGNTKPTGDEKKPNKGTKSSGRKPK